MNTVQWKIEKNETHDAGKRGEEIRDLNDHEVADGLRGAPQHKTRGSSYHIQLLIEPNSFGVLGRPGSANP